MSSLGTTRLPDGIDPVSGRPDEPDAVSRRKASRPSGLRRSTKVLVPVVSSVVAVGLVELYARSGLVDSNSFPPATTDLRVLLDQSATGEFWRATLETAQGWAIGLAIALALAIPLGLAIGSLPLLYRATRPLVEFLRPVPSVALVPMAVLVWGIELNSELFLVAFAAFWPVLVHGVYGARDVDPVARDTARSFNCGRGKTFVRVTLPSALPFLMTGLRISSSIALILAVTAELIIGTGGLGQQINLAQSAGANSLMYAMIIATGLLGLVINGLIALLERWVLAWHPSQRRSAASR